MREFSVWLVEPAGQLQLISNDSRGWCRTDWLNLFDNEKLLFLARA